MTPACIRLLPLAFCLAVPAFALDAPAAAGSPFSAGIITALETSAGLAGGADRGDNTQALTIGHLAWEHPAAASGGVDTRLFVSVLNHIGDGPTERFLGDFLAASNIEACSSTRLYTWWTEIGRDTWSLRAGALLADEEFTGTTAGGSFINSAFGWPAFISANTVNTGPAFYAAAIGARLSHAFTPALTGRIGVYDGDTFDSPDGDPRVNRHGTHYRLGGSQGWFLIGELAWAPENAPTRWKGGVWHHTADFADTYFDAAGQPFALTGAAPRQHRGDFGAYAAVEQSLRGEPGQPGHLDGFLRLGAAPSDRNALGWALDGGLTIIGLIPGRPQDTLALGFAHGEFTHGFVATARLMAPDGGAFHSEQVFELSYTFPIGEHVSCKPDLQLVRHPGGSSIHEDAVLATLRLTAEF